MLNIHPLLLLFLVQFLLIFLGLTVFLFLRLKKSKGLKVIKQGEIDQLQDELQLQSKERAEIAQKNKDLDTYIDSLQKEHGDLNQTTLAVKKELAEVNQKLAQSVTSEEYEKSRSQVAELKENSARLEEKLQQTTKECDDLKKNNVWLEKEYNALYENIGKTK